MTLLFQIRLFALLLSSFVFMSAIQAETTMLAPFSDELNTETYDCLLTLQPAMNVGVAQVAAVLLEYGEGASHLRLEIGTARLRIQMETGTKRSTIGEVKSRVKPGTPYSLTVIRRGRSLVLFHGTTLLFRGMVPRGTGKEATVHCGAGWTLEDARVQRQEPVLFADDFMRTADEKGPWTVESGQWVLQSAWDNLAQGKSYRFANYNYAQNPFAWVGITVGAQPAICTTGDPFWENYTFSVSVQPIGQGAVGVLMNVADSDNRLLARWRPANDRRAGGNELTLYKVIEGKQTVIGKSSGGYMPGQWYRLSVVSSLDGVQVLVDGVPRVASKGVTVWRGGIGLYVEGADGTIFDDLTVYGRGIDADLLAEIRQSRIGKRFRDDQAGMQEWSSAPDQWLVDQAQPDLYWNPDTLYGNRNRIRGLVHPPANATGELTLLLYGDRAAKFEAGYRAVITIDEKGEQTVALFRGTTMLTSKTGTDLLPGGESSICLAHLGTQLILEIDDELVLHAQDATPLDSGFAGYHRQGQAFQSLHEVEVFSRNLLDYTFSEAPVDWYAVGTWEPSIRWSCQPQWSFLSGWSRGDAVLWHKQRFSGDQSLQAFTAVKTEFPREREVYMYSRHQGYFGVTICGDGRDPRNGYSGIYGAPDVDGTPYKRAVLLRNGVEVASTPITAHEWSVSHRSWFVPELSKHENVVTFTVKVAQERYSISYVDPKPLPGGVPAIWTQNNAISVARVRFNSASDPTPWGGPQVFIDQPWYPEWANTGETVTHRFPGSYAMKGKPVTLRVMPREVPDIDANAAVVRGMEVHVTPKATGDHWYTITATDGTNQSPPFHLDQKVFNPALERDDSRALVLYRFDEESGRTVHDQSAITPALDLSLVGEAEALWVPGQGMQFNRSTFLLGSAEQAEKLLLPAKTNACTVEFWLSAETIIGTNMPFWWGDSWENVNLAVWKYAGELHCSTIAYTAKAGDVAGNIFYSSLHHYAVTWDGTTTTAYRDGEVIWHRPVDWATGRWGKRSSFVLAQSFAGSFYLFAMHDRCLTKADIERHYLAGPSAPSVKQ